MLDFLNPRLPGGVRWWHVHAALGTALLVVLVAVLAFISGVFTGASLTVSYYHQHYRAPLTVPAAHVPIRVQASILPSTGSIHLNFFEAKINDQGRLGSCQGWAFTKELSYAFNWNAPYHYRFYSPRFAYDAVSNGNDLGSYLEQYPPIVAASGIPQWTQMPYGAAALLLNLNDYAVDYPIGATYIQEAALHHLSLTEQSLFQYPGAGPGGVSLIKQALASHHMVNIDFPVYPEYDQANATGQTVTLPGPGEANRGGHANAGVRYDDTHDNGDGTHGAILTTNQWGWAAGVGADGVRHTDGSKNGFVWMSYDFVGQYAFGVAVIHVSSTSTGIARASVPPPPATDPNAPLHRAPVSIPVPPQPTASTLPTPGSANWYVHGVVATNGQDLSPLLNHWGDVYKVWPVGLAATVGVESGLNPYAERWAGGLDNSCGLMQQIITNVAYYTGIQGAKNQCRWEENPANSIELGARIYAEDFTYQHNCVTWPQAYGMYNAGAGYLCSYYYNPAGDVQAHLQVFYGWYNLALTRWAGGSPPAPPQPPRPARFGHLHAQIWGQYRKEHHLSFLPHTGYFPWHWRKGNFRQAGGIVQHETYDARRHVMTEYLQGGFAFWHPGHPRWGTQWKGRSRWLR